MGMPYRKLLLAVGINTIIMFLLTYAMISSLDHFHANINRVYMALMMAAPMVIVMLLLMRSMYADARLNRVFHLAAAGVFLGAFGLARVQGGVGNDQFLRSMIPHHSSAILMCEQSSITDPAIIALCETIVRAQKEEIARMETMLTRR